MASLESEIPMSEFIKPALKAGATAGAEEAGKQGAKTFAEAAVKVGEATISHTVAAKRAVTITIINESDLVLCKPRWEMKHGHVASEGLPADEICNTSKDGIVMTFVKSRFSIHGCVGVLLYRYCETKDSSEECYLAVKFKVPGSGQNKGAIAILSQKDLDESDHVHTFDFVTPKLYNYVNKEYFKGPDKHKNIDQVRSKSCKWMEVFDQKKKVVFGCTMSGEDQAAIKVKISKQE
jgi:hypothetical protein